MNHTVDLRKINLGLEAVSSLFNTVFSRLKGSFSTSIERSSSKQKAQIECDKNNYHTSAPKRNAKAANVERALTNGEW